MTHVGVQSGSGVVARYGDVVVLVADDEPFAGSLLDAVAAADPGRIAWQLLPVLTEDAAPFAVAAPIDGGWQLLLHGPVRAVVDGGEVLGSSATTWVDCVCTGDALALSLAETGPVAADPRSDLQGGVVRGSGAVLSRSAAAAPTPAPAPAPAPEPAPEPVVERTAVDVRATADVTPQAAVPADANATMAVRLDQVGALVADDGTRTILDRSYVLGRDPSQSEAVRSGAATPIVVDDPDNLISRVQVTVRVDNGLVTVTDESSANGTFVAGPGAPDWDRVAGSAALPVGWSMRLGKRVFTHVAGA